MAKRGVKNDAGIFGARKGVLRGKEFTFTHRNPKNGKIYGEDIPWGITEKGAWVPSELVKFK